MTVGPVHLGRVSFNQRVNHLQDALRRNNVDLFGVQSQLASGLKFERPSDDPNGARAATRIDRLVERLGHVGGNLRHVNSVLTEAESAAQEASDLLKEARQLGLSAVGDSMTPDERQSIAVVVSSILEQTVLVANRKFQDAYLFSGHQGELPFQFDFGGVLYRGDGQRRVSVVEVDGRESQFTVPGSDVFASLSSEVAGVADLDPALTRDTLLTDLDGALGRGVRLGRLVVTAGGESTSIDLTGAATVGDLLDRLNTALPSGMSAAMTLDGVTLQGGGGREIAIQDVPGGHVAVDLGLAGTDSAADRVGADLNPRITPRTAIAALRGGSGLPLDAPLRIRNGVLSATIDLSGAATVEDIFNRINFADVGALARVSSDGRRVDIVSRLSGADLFIEEAGGQTAELLGVRSLHAGTPLSALNGGRGVPFADGLDARLTTRSGASIDVDFSGAETIGDVLDLLNAAGAGQVSAALATDGNGIILTDNTAGAGTFSAVALNQSLALVGLGLDGASNGAQIVGRDVNPQRVDSVFTGLVELRGALERDDRAGIQTAVQRIERTLDALQGAQGELASMAKQNSDRVERIDAETSAARVLLSDIRDADFPELAVRFQRLQLALEANMTTARQVMNLSVLDYLQ